MFALLRKHYPIAMIPEDQEGGETDKQIWDVNASTALVGMDPVGDEYPRYSS